MTFQCTEWVAGGRCGSCEATGTDYAYPKNRSPSFGRKACKWNSNAAILFSSLLFLTILVEYLCLLLNRLSILKNTSLDFIVWKIYVSSES